MKKLNALEIIEFKKLLEQNSNVKELNNKTPLLFSRFKYIDNQDYKTRDPSWLYDIHIHTDFNNIVEYHFLQFIKNVQKDIELQQNGLGE